MTVETRRPGARPALLALAVDAPSRRCRVVAPRGEIDAHNASTLRAQVIEAMQPPAVTRLVFDLSRTTFLDSSALGVVVGAVKRLRERDGTVDVVLPAMPVRRIFEITGLDQILALHETLADALADSTEP